MQQPLQHFDVIIAGGSLSGCLTALSLAKLSRNNRPLSIAIIEANPLEQSAKQTTTKSFDQRVLALSHHTASYLQQLSVWQHLVKQAYAINTIHISDRGHYGKARIYANEHHVEALGYVVEMQALGMALMQALKPYHNITWFAGHKITDICWLKEQVNVQISSVQTDDNHQAAQSLSAQLLIACDGAHSVCRRFANIQSTQKSYHQAAVITNVRMAQPHQHVAYERFTEFGPIAVLPLNDSYCSVVWTIPEEQIEKIKPLSDADFIAAFNQAFGTWLGGVVEVGERVVYPLELVQAANNVFHRMALVGNASHTIHPIAGQGFNLGVRDILTLSELITKQLASEEKTELTLGSFAMLNQYDLLRKQDQHSIIGLTDSLVALFSNQYTPLVAGRNIGLKALNYLSPIKQAFVEKTMGY